MSQMTGICLQPLHQYGGLIIAQESLFYMSTTKMQGRGCCKGCNNKQLACTSSCMEVFMVISLLKDALGVPVVPAGDAPPGRWFIITSTRPFMDEEERASTDVWGVAAVSQAPL